MKTLNPETRFTLDNLNNKNFCFEIPLTASRPSLVNDEIWLTCPLFNRTYYSSDNFHPASFFCREWIEKLFKVPVLLNMKYRMAIRNSNRGSSNNVEIRVLNSYYSGFQLDFGKGFTPNLTGDLRQIFGNIFPRFEKPKTFYVSLKVDKN